METGVKNKLMIIKLMVSKGKEEGTNQEYRINRYKLLYRTPLVIPWQKIYQPMQETQVQYLVWEDST